MDTPAPTMSNPIPVMNVVFTEPDGDRYRNRHETPFGKPVTLPLDTPATLETTEF